MCNHATVTIWAEEEFKQKEIHMTDNPQITPLLVVIITFGLLFIITNTLALGLSLHIGQLIAHFFKNWKLAVWVLLVNFVILPVIIIGFAAVVPIPGDVKIGFCVVALAAGAPFAPAITRLAKGNVAMSVSLMVVLMVVTIIVLPFALPPAVAWVKPGVNVAAWDIAWPLLIFLAIPLLVGILIRLRYDDVAVKGARLLQLVSVACLLVHVTLYVTAFWNEFASAWGTGTYAAAIVVPILGILFGTILSFKDVGTRHACAITTAQRNVSAGILMCLFPFGPRPLVSVTVLAINGIGIVLLLILGMEWGRAQARKGAVAASAATQE
jgi:bile acid:Na+ symporter, BASS family